MMMMVIGNYNWDTNEDDNKIRLNVSIGLCKYLDKNICAQKEYRPEQTDDVEHADRNNWCLRCVTEWDVDEHLIKKKL